MSNSADQDKPIAANGNAAEPQDVEIMCVLLETIISSLLVTSPCVLFCSHFQPQEKQCCRVIKTNKTKVLTSGGVHTRGSSKVKLKNIVDYKWERKYYYPGHLVAVHRDGKHLAYAINGKL